MFMPALALAIPLAAIIAQLLKQSLKETMHLDYVTLARTKGYSETQVIWREALPNAILPTLTLVGVQFTFLIGGTVIIERLFSYEGLGNMAIDAVINRDLPLIQGIVILFAVMFTVVNLVVDLTVCRPEPEAAAWLTVAAQVRRRAGLRLWLSAGWLAAAGAGGALRALDRAAGSAGAGPVRWPPAAVLGARAPTRATGWAPTAWAAMCCPASSLARASR